MHIVMEQWFHGVMTNIWGWFAQAEKNMVDQRKNVPQGRMKKLLKERDRGEMRLVG